MKNKLKAARVAIAGLGGLGSNVAVMLARSGVGELLLVDFDCVEASNLNRQTYTVKHLGMRKADVLKEQLADINPSVKVVSRALRVTEDNVDDLFSGFPIICEAFDNPECKAMLVNAVLGRMPRTKIVAGSGMGGYASANLIKTKRTMKNLYVCGDLVSEVSDSSPPMAPRVMICAAHQANMIIRLILGEEDT